MKDMTADLEHTKCSFPFLQLSFIAFSISLLLITTTLDY